MKKSIGFIINKGYGNSDLIHELVNILEMPEAKYEVIELTEKMLSELMRPQMSSKKSSYSYNDDYTISQQKNNLAELGFMLHASLFEYDEAIQFYKKYAYHRDNEVKLYMLIGLLFQEGQTEYIKKELEMAQRQGEKLRSSLMKLLETINETGILPRSIY